MQGTVPSAQSLLVLAGPASSPRPSSSSAPTPERPATTVSAAHATVVAYHKSGGSLVGAFAASPSVSSWTWWSP
jgi:hypothetical protein